MPAIRSMFYALLFLMLYGLSPVQPENGCEIAPGSKEINTSSIHVHQWNFSMYAETDSSRKKIGSYRETLRILSKDGVVERVLTLDTPRGHHRDSVRARMPKLTPVTHHSENVRRTMTMIFNDDKVRSTFKPDGGDLQASSYELASPCFDSSWVDYIIRLLPLKEDYTGNIRTFELSSVGKGRVVHYAIRVTGKKQFEIDGGKNVPVWVVESRKENSTTRFWIGRNNRELYRIEVPTGPGSRMLIDRDTI